MYRAHVKQPNRDLSPQLNNIALYSTGPKPFNAGHTRSVWHIRSNSYWNFEERRSRNLTMRPSRDERLIITTWISLPDNKYTPKEWPAIPGRRVYFPYRRASLHRKAERQVRTVRQTRRRPKICARGYSTRDTSRAVLMKTTWSESNKIISIIKRKYCWSEHGMSW